MDKKIHLNTLKIANINSEGPSKTATGGMNADTLLKYGKTFTIEMQDAMGRADVLEELYGADISANNSILAISDRFAGEMTVVGKTFVIDQKTGAKQPVRIIIPVFLCDSIFNLTQDAEGDISTFDLNGNILKFEADAEGKVTAEGKYDKGSDNLFYFFATEEAYKNLLNKGYRGAQASYTDTATHAKLEAMLAKFATVTVMDVDIYPTVRFEKDTTETINGSSYAYEEGEWDAIGTLTQFLTYKLTSDTVLDTSKTYYTRTAVYEKATSFSSTETYYTESSGTYTAVSTPSEENLSTYYVLSEYTYAMVASPVSGDISKYYELA